LEAGYLLLELPRPLLKRTVPLPEAIGAQLVIEVEAVGLVHVIPEPPLFADEHVEEVALFPKSPVPVREVSGDLLLGEEEYLELRLEDPLQVVDGNLVAALVADPLRGVRRDVELGAAVAEGEAGEEVDGLAGGRLLLALLKEGVGPLPDLLRDNGLDAGVYPLRLGLSREAPCRSCRRSSCSWPGGDLWPWGRSGSASRWSIRTTPWPSSGSRPR
jgi:hypothetical protein